MGVRGTTGSVLFGECRGSGSKPYLACVNLTEPAYRCSCPSRKFPCKHALGLLLLWSADGVPVEEAAPQWVTEWLDARAERAARSATKIEAARAKSAEPPRPSTPLTRTTLSHPPVRMSARMPVPVHAVVRVPVLGPGSGWYGYRRWGRGARWGGVGAAWPGGRRAG